MTLLIAYVYQVPHNTVDAHFTAYSTGIVPLVYCTVDPRPTPLTVLIQYSIIRFIIGIIMCTASCTFFYGAACSCILNYMTTPVISDYRY
jgi:hypothetical protein